MIGHRLSLATTPLRTNVPVLHIWMMVEKKDPIDGAMVARVVSGETVMAGDEIIFELHECHRACDCGLLSVCGGFP